MSASSRPNPPANTPPNPQGHRRDNQSVSSNHSSGRNERTRQPAQPPHPAVESAVTRLLVAIKQLLEALTLWSTLRMDENQVSDVYVRLGNDFNAAVAAFAAFNIDMAELMSVPDDLRNVLEQCLAEDATAENLEVYLPTVRQIITNLLQGLREKQSIYRRIVSDHRHRSDQLGHERTESRSSRGERTRREGHRSQLSRTLAENEQPERDSRDSVSRRNGQSATRRREPVSQASTLNGDTPSAGGLMFEQSAERTPEYDNNSPNLYDPSSQRSQLPPAPTDLPSPPEPVRQVSLPTVVSSEATVIPPPTPPAVPASVKRYSLVDEPVSPPAVVVEPYSPSIAEDYRNGSSTPPSDTRPMDSPPPAMANSLAALKKNDVLERRASKRFSTYNISKMTGATTRERSARGRHNSNRRSLAVSSALTPGELAVLTEVDDEEPEPSLRREASTRSRRSLSRTETPERPQTTPSVSPVPATPARTPDPVSEPNGVVADQAVVEQITQPPPSSSKMTVFLQLGREVKKVIVGPGLSFASLRVLFVDKFSYNPGLENFPAIYIRDPSSGVQYELEDTDEVKEKCLLSLNIEPLDQIKQHIDTQMSTLSQDIKELRTVVAENTRNSHLPPHIVAHPLAESTPAPNRPTDRQFQQVARRLSRFVGDSPSPFSSQSPPPPSQITPQTTGQSLQPQMTGGSVLSDYTSRVVTDLKTQFDEVQNLRRDLGIMRQLYTEFVKQTKESLGTLRGQTQSVKQLANTSVGGARGYIDSGKKKLDTRSQTVLTDVEKLQDTVEGVKDDVIKRHVTPKALHLKNTKKDIDTVAAELQSLKEHIKTIKPMWKKTWEEELQNIVEEQQFLSHQEEFLNDLLEDHKAVVEVYGHVEKVINLRGAGPARMPRNRSFRPPPPEPGHAGLSTVMLEIRGAAIDPDRRMKAIEANQKNREKELAARSDDLQAELTEFVGGRKLKMTGGAEEAERVRQKRSDMTLKAMFTGGSVSSMNSPLSSGSQELPSPS